MAIPSYNGDTNYISLLADKPVTDGGLTSAQFKAKFDQFGTEFKTWLNGTFISALNSTFQTVIDATHKLSGSYLTNKSVTATQIADATITNAKIANNAAIDGTKLASNAALTNIGSGNITGGYLSANSVTTVKIKDANVTDAKIANLNSTGHIWQIYVTNTVPTSSSPDGIYLVY